MAINLKNFVDVNIVQHQANVVSATRDTAVLICGYDTGLKTVFTTASIDEFLCDSVASYNALCNTHSASPNTTIQRYLTYYFNNGGLKVLLLALDDPSGTAGGNTSQINNLLNPTSATYIGNKYILICYTGSDYTASSFEGLSLTGINKKLFITHFNSYATASAISTENYIAKYSLTSGIEMTIAAYLVRINAYEANTVKDYAFTAETITAADDKLADSDANAIVQTPTLNGDIYLAGAYRNIGGNDTKGNDLVNQYMLIVLQQTLTDKLINVLTSKIKYDQYGINMVSATITNELANYVTNGYLTTDKSWTYDDLIYEGYTLITKGSPIPKGFAFMILPLSTLTEQEKQLHQFPNIYVVLATSYGIRKIVIGGEAI